MLSRSPSSHPPPPSQLSTDQLDGSKEKPKKPRHRHSPAQLAALNELYDKNEHPSLELRSSLAERLGMETKTVNAWFQNKRASSKKRTRGVPYDGPHITSHIGSTSSSTTNTPRHIELDDFHDEYIDSHHHSQDNSHHLPSLYPGNTDYSHFLADSDSMPRRMRMRPTQEQSEELKRLYDLNPHPTTDQRQVLSERIGMRYQSITNWFQNQRSLAKKRKEDEAEIVSFASSNAAPFDYPNEQRMYSAFPPPSTHPSLVLPSQPHSSSFVYHGRSLHSRSVSPSMDEPSSRRFPSRRSTTPYGSAASYSRPRRSRPEPYQLDALKDLYTKTPTPSIEERSALALEIGMDLGKVTNWFRNLRQTARKRQKKSGSGSRSHALGSNSADEDDDDAFHLRHPHSSFASRSGTPSFHSSASSTNGDCYPDGHRVLMDMDDEFDQGMQSGSEDEFQEAVTPSPQHSPPPHPPHPMPPTASAGRTTRGIPTSSGLIGLGLAVDAAAYAELEKTNASQYKGIKVEDALLLLSFHQHIVH